MRKAGFVLVALFLVAAACGGGTDSSDASDDTVTTTSGVETDATTTSEAEADGGVETLADFVPAFGFNDDPEAAEAEFRRQEQQAQELIRDCMAAEGFDYVPFVPDEDMFFGPGSDLSEDEFAEQYGYGITTFFFEEMDFDPAEDEFFDPNQEIVEAMDEATQEEYYRVLYGEEPDIDFENMTEEEIDAAFQDFEPTGCDSEAHSEVFGGQGFYEEFSDELDAMYEKTQADPRIVAAEAEWSQCMAEAGHDFTTMEDIYTYLDRRMNEVVTYAEPSPEEMAEIEAQFGEEGPTEEQMAEMDQLFGPQYDDAELRALNEEEISIAIADRTCASGRDELFEEVYREYEAEFIDENRGALEAWRDANG